MFDVYLYHIRTLISERSMQNAFQFFCWLQQQIQLRHPVVRFHRLQPHSYERKAFCLHPPHSLRIQIALKYQKKMNKILLF